MWDIARKSIKAFLLSVIVFFLLSLALAGIIYFTDFRENWAFLGLIAILSVSALMLGFMEGNIIGKKGLLSGLIAALLLVLGVFLMAGAISGEQYDGGINAFHCIPLLMGSIGGMVGTNMRK